MKKVFIISGILLGVTLFILVAYNFAFKKSIDNSQTKPKEQTTMPTQPIVEKKNEKITLVSNEPVLGGVADKKTEKILYYSALNGSIWQMDSDGTNTEQITSSKLTGLVNVAWSPDKTKVLTTFSKDGKLTFFSYDNLKKAGVQLKDGLDNTVWDSFGAKIFYKYYDSTNKKRSLNIANPDGSNWLTLVDNLPYRDLSIAVVPLTSMVSFWNFPNVAEESSLQIVSTAGGEAKSVLNGKLGADYQWSPDGKQALVSSLISKENRVITLGLVDLLGDYRDLGIPTLVSKCSWSVDNKTIFCALPGGIPAGSNMPNDYQEKKFTTQDTFWKINITTGNKERVVELADIKESYDASNLFLSPTENSLFFTNRRDGKLYRIAL